MTIREGLIGGHIIRSGSIRCIINTLKTPRKKLGRKKLGRKKRRRRRGFRGKAKQRSSYGNKNVGSSKLRWGHAWRRGAKLTGKAVSSGGKDDFSDELTKLRMANEELKKKLGESINPTGDDKIMYLQREIMELRKQIAGKHLDEDVILALQAQIGELKQSAYMKTNFEKEIAGLRKEIGVLREQNEQIKNESNLWKEEAARPGNKRGSVVIGTPEGTNRGTPKPQWTGSARAVSLWINGRRNIEILEVSIGWLISKLRH
ncbi:hypothetical protein CBR_g8381 [Chara braunii]|uniref:Uncharacterized protein n=1 Tax=Chara braunii TaxID=69332 RepID=A0A388KM09_CHABU|nr:hypothetical protein CBR_g8381 [Chara braunii]|eukprot:GBG71081.1 hypothetical protein CBR_g8381 [Chara braunii]